MLGGEVGGAPASPPCGWCFVEASSVQVTKGCSRHVSSAARSRRSWISLCRQRVCHQPVKMARWRSVPHWSELWTLSLVSSCVSLCNQTLERRCTICFFSAVLPPARSLWNEFGSIVSPERLVPHTIRTERNLDSSEFARMPLQPDTGPPLHDLLFLCCSPSRAIPTERIRINRVTREAAKFGLIVSPLSLCVGICNQTLELRCTTCESLQLERSLLVTSGRKCVRFFFFLLFCLLLHPFHKRFQCACPFFRSGEH